MGEVRIIGIDLAKHVFQLHGADPAGTVVFRKKLSRTKLLPFLASQRKCVVAMEACAGAHHWSRAINALGHEARLIAPAYVQPFVKRQKNDMADAEAIAEAAARPTMRFVVVKSAEKQASSMVFKTRDLLVRQRTQTINALRGHLTEYGVVAPQGTFHLGRLAAEVEDGSNGLPAAVAELCSMLLGHIRAFDQQIAVLDRRIRERAREDETVRRLMTVPGIGPIAPSLLYGWRAARKAKMGMAPAAEAEATAVARPSAASGHPPRTGRRLHLLGLRRRDGEARRGRDRGPGLCAGPFSGAAPCPAEVRLQALRPDLRGAAAHVGLSGAVARPSSPVSLTGDSSSG